MDYNSLAQVTHPEFQKEGVKRETRQMMRGLQGANFGNWNPMDDAQQALSYQDPAYQNESLRSAAMAEQPSMTPWQQYSSVLQARGVGFDTAKPSSIAENPESTWNTNQIGPRPWGPSINGLKRAR